MDKKLSYTAEEIDRRLGLVPELQKLVGNADINGRIFSTIDAASLAITKPKEGSWVLVGAGPYTVYRYSGTAWVNTGVNYQQGAATSAAQVTDTNQNKTQQTINSEVSTQIQQLQQSTGSLETRQDTAEQNIEQAKQNVTDLALEIGDLSQLNTDAKGSLVEAINEAATKGGGGGGGESGPTSKELEQVKIIEAYYVTSAGLLKPSSTQTNRVAYYEITKDIIKIDVIIPKTGNTATYPVSFASDIELTSNLVTKKVAGDTNAMTFELEKTEFSPFRYLVLNYNSAGGTPSVVGTLEQSGGGEGGSGTIPELDLSYKKEYTENDCNYIYGAYINASGAEYEYRGFKCTNYISVFGVSITLTCDFTSSGSTIIAFYDGDFAFVSSVKAATQNKAIIAIPNGAKYVRFSVKEGSHLTAIMESESWNAMIDKTEKRGEAIRERKTNILMVGNSFSVNMSENIGTILSNLEIKDLTFSYYQYAGSSYQYWVTNFNNGVSSVTRKYGIGSFMGNTIESILQNNYIDIITIQQSSDLSGDYNASIPYLYEYITKIRKASINPDIKIALIMTWGRGNVPYENIKSTIKQIAENYRGIDMIIPVGTAIESCRLSDFSNGHNQFSKDSSVWHLAKGFGEYASSCALYQSMIYPITNISIEGDNTTISVSGGLGEVALTDANRGFAHKAALMASIMPYTPIKLD